MCFYTDEELQEIITTNAMKLNLKIQDDNCLLSLASKSRGTPRIANTLLYKARDYAQLENNCIINSDIINRTLKLEGIDNYGLSKLDKKYVFVLFKTFGAGPARSSSNSVLHVRRLINRGKYDRALFN